MRSGYCCPLKWLGEVLTVALHEDVVEGVCNLRDKKG